MQRSYFQILRLLAVAATIAAASNAPAVTRSYHIGNSLTFDSQPEGIAALAASRGLEHEVGFHILSAASLGQILSNPDEVTVEPNAFGTFEQALPNYAWDVVTIQPHPHNPIVTLADDTASILSFIDLARSNPANAETNFYIYQTWPQLTGTPYQTLWNKSSPNSPDTPISRSREYYANLIESVRASTDANVYMIPTGEVFYELDIKIRAGELPGYTSISQFYRDITHMNFNTGRFIAGVTVFSTILGQYPTELEKPEGSYGAQTSPNPVQTAIILETIRAVLDAHPYSGVEMPEPLYADFNDDNVVDEIDREMLIRSMGIENAFDANQDGMTNGRDFLYWQKNYKAIPTGQDLADLAVADLNGDGLYDSADLQHWHDSYGNGAGADADGDGDTDGRDFLVWQRAQPSNPADWNRDFLVDGADLVGWQNSYGYYAAADANGDGIATLDDYVIWEQENGRTWTFPYAVSAPPLPSQLMAMQALGVPEPNAAILSIVGALLTFSGWRGRSTRWPIR